MKIFGIIIGTAPFAATGQIPDAIVLVKVPKTLEENIAIMRNQLPFLPAAFADDSRSDSKAPESDGTTKERAAIDAFRRAWLNEIEWIPEIQRKLIPFRLEFTSLPFEILMDMNPPRIAEQVKLNYRAIRRMAEIEIGTAIIKQKIKSFIGADRSVLFGKWDLKNEGNKIWYSCKVNLWATSK
jgi:hypothetical protein